MFGYLSGKLFDLISSFGKNQKISSQDIEKALFAIQETLVNADVPFKLVKELSDKIRLDLADVNLDSKINLQDRVQTILFNKILELLGGKESDEKAEQFEFKKKSIILVAGLQGAGKTTTISKLAVYLKNKGASKILTTSLDFVRPAAVEQLKILAQKVKIDFIDPIFGDNSKTIDTAKKMFNSENYDYLLVDTPGRLHVNQELMKELQNINLALEPNYKILVIDSMTGQESLNVAKTFDSIVDISGAILTKADSDSKGGVALSFFSFLKKPVLFLGAGEKAEDLEKFVPKRIASRMLGSGDILTLVEQIEKKVTEEDRNKQGAASERFLAGKHTLQDFLEQMELMNSMGSLQKIMSYLPGFSKVSNDQILQAEKEIKKLKAMILSLTPKERLFPELLNKSRRARIAKGSGLSEQEVTGLLNKFEESKRYARMIGSGGWKNKF